MNNLRSKAENFKVMYEKFLNGCDSIEKMGLWDLEQNGEMDAYYSHDLVSIIVRLIAADGNITYSEVKYLNDMFGFRYTVEELATIYRDNGDAIDAIFDEGARNGLNLMRSINEKIADAYFDLIVAVCDIIIASDGVIASAEIELARKIKALKNI